MRGLHISRKHEGMAFKRAGERVDLRFTQPEYTKRQPARVTPPPRHWCLEAC